jgi:hypothetical protein
MLSSFVLEVTAVMRRLLPALATKIPLALILTLAKPQTIRRFA